MSYELADGHPPQNERRLKHLTIAIIGSSGPGKGGARGAGYSFIATSKPDLITQDGFGNAEAPPGRKVPTINDAICQGLIKILRDLVARLRALEGTRIEALAVFVRSPYVADLLAGRHDGTRHKHLLAYRDEIHALLNQLAPERVRIECPVAEAG